MIVHQALYLALAGAGIVITMMFVLWLIHLAIRNAAIEIGRAHV